MKIWSCLLATVVWVGSPAAADTADEALLEDTHVAHIGIVVADLEKAVAHWTKVLGLAESPSIMVGTGHPDNPTRYHGQPTAGQVRLAFFNLENIQIELLSPHGEGTTEWSEFLRENGTGVHHIAFFVKGLGEVYVDRLQERGIGIAQQGGWDGGEYLYTDTRPELGVAIELLEDYNRK